MRRAELVKSLGNLQKKYVQDAPDVRELGPGITVNLSQPCIVVGGRNGAGKSRLLRNIAAQNGINGVIVDLHHLAEQVLISLRARTDLGAMLEEYTPSDLSENTVSAVSSVIGRRYSSVNWYSLEIEPSDPLVAERFKWGGDQSLIPYFEVTHGGVIYDTLAMGLGEFCVHFLFWIIEQYREVSAVTLMLDEPDAYLPPVGVSLLLHHIADVCLRNSWKVVLSTHSEEMIKISRDHKLFTLLQVDGAGISHATHSSDDSNAGDSLLGKKGIEHVLFCEDESAANLMRAVLQSKSLEISRRTDIIWGNGHGYLRTLQVTIPRPPKPDLHMAYIFDGDQRDTVAPSTDRQWSIFYLPTTKDPDALFMGLETHPAELARSLGAPEAQLAEFLSTLTAEDPHDWVNALCHHFGRGHTLSALAAFWCRLHPYEVEELIKQLDIDSNLAG